MLTWKPTQNDDDDVDDFTYFLTGTESDGKASRIWG